MGSNHASSVQFTITSPKHHRVGQVILLTGITSASISAGRSGAGYSTTGSGDGTLRLDLVDDDSIADLAATL
jgi:hypothetical protein